MAATGIVDAGFLIALLDRRDKFHAWASAQASEIPPPWQTCEAVLSEAFYVVSAEGREKLAMLLRRRSVLPTFNFAGNSEPVLLLMHKYSNVPMSIADACLVRMTEVLPEPVVLTTDTDFRIYRRHSRQVVPCRMPR